MQTQSQRLRQAIRLARPRLMGLVGDVWAHPRLGELYPEFLFALYGITAASAPLLRAGAERAAELPGEDATGTVLAAYLGEHAEEEAGHELWILDDLESLGIARARALERLPYPSAAVLTGAQYYWALHVHPAALLGYIAVVEEPASREALEGVSARAGIPLGSMTTHVRHAELDGGHMAEFDAVLDALPLTGRQRDLVTVSALTTVAHLQRFFEEVLERFGRAEEQEGAGEIFTARGRAQTAQVREGTTCL